MVSIRVRVRCDALSGRAKTRETRKFLPGKLSCPSQPLFVNRFHFFRVIIEIV